MNTDTDAARAEVYRRARAYEAVIAALTYYYSDSPAAERLIKMLESTK